MIDDIQDFHDRFDIAYYGKPRNLPYDLMEFRENFMAEELQEYSHACYNCDMAIDENDRAEVTHQLEQQLDALVDLIYVALGTAHLQGFDIEEAWKRVHEANMKKIRTPSADASQRGNKYDVIKPPDWVPPSHKDLVEDHIHQQGTLSF